MKKMAAGGLAETMAGDALTVVNANLTIRSLLSDTTTPTMDRSDSVEWMRWARDKQSVTKITLSKPRSPAIVITRCSAIASAISGEEKPGRGSLTAS
jgi:hypothetical protein